MTNREVINGMGNEELGRFLSHMDCVCCSYYSEAGPNVCSKISPMETPDIRDCAKGRTEWLDQKAGFRMKDYIHEEETE